MLTDSRSFSVLAAGLLLVTPSTASSQSSDLPLVLVDDATVVNDVGFRFLRGSALSSYRLQENIAYEGPGGFAGVRSALDFLPGISAPEPEAFSPLTLQRDVARIRELYRRAGYPQAVVDYDVELDTEANSVNVTFIVDQGEPITLSAVQVRIGESVADNAMSDGGTELRGLRSPQPQEWPDRLHRQWDEHRRRLSQHRGEAFSEQLRSRMVDQTIDWFRGRGYPWAGAHIASVDTTDLAVDVEIAARPGPRARVDSVVIESSGRLSEDVLRREIPIREGDWYDDRAVAAGERELLDLDLVRRALGDLTDTQTRDSTVAIRFRIDEARPRLLWGRAGWRSEAGLAGDLQWSHRDFLGGARVFTAAVTAESGIGALEPVRNRSIGVSLLVRQPYVWHRSVSAAVRPFLQYREDFGDRSRLFGLETSLIYHHADLETFTIQHELSRNRIDEALLPLPVSELFENGGATFEPTFVRSVFKAIATYGKLDDPLAPRSGFRLQPSAEVTGPTSLSDVEYFRLALEAVGAVPLSERTGLFIRLSGGRLFPYGESDPVTSDSPLRAAVGVRRVMFTAGGMFDLRGWSQGLAGPKVPLVIVEPDGVSIERYVPVGGLARVTGSVDLELPFPFLRAQHRTYVFVDAGRVWSPDPGFGPGDPELALDPWLYSVGGGLQFSTVAGPVRLGVGYKLNPTIVDLLAPTDVAGALRAGEDLSTLERSGLRRWHVHLSIGRGL